jgi:hypothetical protein
MNNLVEFYEFTKDFAERHMMVNEFFVLGNEEELQGLDFDYRAFVLIPLGSNISREGNRPVYTVEFLILVGDKADENDAMQLLSSTEENIFVIGQFQDYLQQEMKDAEFGDIEIVNQLRDDYNITSAYTRFTMTFERKSYTRPINLKEE